MIRLFKGIFKAIKDEICEEIYCSGFLNYKDSFCGCNVSTYLNIIIWLIVIFLFIVCGFCFLLYPHTFPVSIFKYFLNIFLILLAKQVVIPIYRILVGLSYDIAEQIDKMRSHKSKKENKKESNIKIHESQRECKVEENFNRKNFKDYILDEINIIQKMISKLSKENQSRFQLKLFDLIKTYKEKIKEFRHNSNGLTLVYEHDIDVSFFQKLVSLGEDIKIAQATDANAYATYDKSLDDTEQFLREALNIAEAPENQIVRTREKDLKQSRRKGSTN